jgi:hypothetical protein
MARRPSMPRHRGPDADDCAEPAVVGRRSAAPLDVHLAEIAGLDLPSLQASWEALFGQAPPKGLSRRLLELATAYGSQAKIHGGLTPAAQRKLLQAGRASPDMAAGAPRQNRRSALSPGSRLVREWQGRCHTVEATEGGFLYAGRRYRSLSEVARTITGARWSGPRFFGL